MLFQEQLITSFKQYSEAIYNYVFFRVNRSKEIAEDLTQEVFLKAWQNREKFEEQKSQLKTWLFVIARNTVIDYYRKNKNILPIFDKGEVAKVSELEAVEDKILAEDILQRIAELADEERDILILRYFEDFELKEIAVIINKNYSATKVLVFRSLKKLKNLLTHGSNKR